MYHTTAKTTAATATATAAADKQVSHHKGRAVEKKVRCSML
jgi:hypothetical protein